MVRHIEPNKTALILGAGAAIPSGAPNGEELAAHLWKKFEKTSLPSSELKTISSILCVKHGRTSVVREIISLLQPLKPTGGLLALPRQNWGSIFTTNYDQLLEKSFRQCGVDFDLFRSNYDFSTNQSSENTQIYKIHGCITQDTSLGHKAGMILTESDYEIFASYREASFGRMNEALLTKDIVIIGQSLADQHLNEMANSAAKFKNDRGAPGSVYIVSFSRDEDLAIFFEQKGLRVSFGSIDDFSHQITKHEEENASDEDEIEASPDNDPVSFTLPSNLVSTVFDAASSKQLRVNIKSMFNGKAANYSEIASGATFDRTVFDRLSRELFEGKSILVTITGAAGVGKTTLARQFVSQAADQGFLAWEHNSDFPLVYQNWLGVESTLRENDQAGYLFIDECTYSQRQVNLLVEGLSKIDSPSLQLVLTSNSALWAPRLKSPDIFNRGILFELSYLDEPELNSLLTLLENNREISDLVTADFKSLPRSERKRKLEQRCHKDMFVCLKNIFDSDSLDTIILKEFNDLENSEQEHYRYIAALEAIGARVHRQLVIRMLDTNINHLERLLERLTGVVDEYEIDKNDGIYGWSTRHIVIARLLTQYKFPDLTEMTTLFERLIDSLNPSVRIELRTINQICDQDHGIGRIPESDVRINLYEKLIKKAPAERVPWHRLIRETLYNRDIEEIDQVIRRAEESVGVDSPIDRYKVRALIERSKKTQGISDTDRRAMLHQAHELSLKNIGRHPRDKYSYMIACDVAYRICRGGATVSLFDETLKRFSDASDRLNDPDVFEKLREYEVKRRDLI